MTLTEIKKELYKQKPKANFLKANKTGLFYRASLPWDAVDFLIPLSDIGDATFRSEIESQLLIRYIVTPEIENK